EGLPTEHEQCRHGSHVERQHEKESDGVQALAKRPVSFQAHGLESPWWVLFARTRVLSLFKLTAEAGKLCNSCVISCGMELLQYKLAEDPASSRMESNMHARRGEPGAIVSRGRVTEKCGERRWKLILRNSRWSPFASATMAEDISFFQSLRVLTTNGPLCSKPQGVRLVGKLFPVRASQRKLWTCRLNAGGSSKSASNVSISRWPLALLSSQFRGNSHGGRSTTTHARLNPLWRMRKGTLNCDRAIQRIPATWPCPASAPSIQRSTCRARRRL